MNGFHTEKTEHVENILSLIFRRISKCLLTIHLLRDSMYLEEILNSLEVRDNVGFSETMKALSDPVRREILNMLKSGTMSAGDIADHFDIAGASVSYHLSQLKHAGLVFERREKNYIYYSLNASVLEEVLLWLQSLKGEDTDEKQ